MLPYSSEIIKQYLKIYSFAFFGQIFIESYYLLSAMLNIKRYNGEECSLVSEVGPLGYFQFISRKN